VDGADIYSKAVHLIETSIIQLASPNVVYFNKNTGIDIGTYVAALSTGKLLRTFEMEECDQDNIFTQLPRLYGNTRQVVPLYKGNLFKDYTAGFYFLSRNSYATPAFNQLVLPPSILVTKLQIRCAAINPAQATELIVNIGTNLTYTIPLSSTVNTNFDIIADSSPALIGITTNMAGSIERTVTLQLAIGGVVQPDNPLPGYIAYEGQPITNRFEIVGTTSVCEELP
jgi:hypothetical protein